jgi:hypothetical protein
MNDQIDQTTGVDHTDEGVLTYEVSDDALEEAAGMGEGLIRTQALPTYPPGYCCF